MFTNWHLFEWFHLLYWFTPIPFMLLYHVKSTQLNSLVYPTIAVFLSFPLILLGMKTHINFDVVLCYTISVVLGLYVLTRKHDYPQALSLSFILSFLNSLYWEIPVHIYTILYRGYIDQAMPLHLLNAFPLVFINQKVKITDWKKTSLLLTSGLVISIIFMLPLILTGVLPSFLDSSPPPTWTEVLWVANRLICFVPLLYIVYRSELNQ